MLPAAMPGGYARHPVLLYLLSLLCTRQRSQVHNGMVRLLLNVHLLLLLLLLLLLPLLLPATTSNGQASHPALLCVFATQKICNGINAR